MFNMAIRRVDPSIVSTTGMLDSLTVCYIRFLDLLYATTKIDKDCIRMIAMHKLINPC